MHKIHKNKKLATMLGVLTLLIGVFFIGCGSTQKNEDITLVVFQNNDGEGGAASFVSLLNTLRDQAQSEGKETITLTSGDNFLSGNTITASRRDNIFYDAIVLSTIKYDAIGLGNHDFDFGPDKLADFIQSVDKKIPYVATNFDFTQEARLHDLFLHLF